MLASSANNATMGSTRGPLSEFPPDADWQAIADRLYESNCALVKRAEALQANLQEKQQELDVRAVQLLSLEEAQTTKATEAAVALQACQARDREQLRAIATLSERLAVSQVRAEQLEQECLALQATCREQAERTTCAQKEIQDLHARLQQQQQQTAQAQDALERYLAERTANNSRSNAWPPPIIDLGKGDRAGTEATATAALAVEAMPEVAATVAVSVDLSRHEPSDLVPEDAPEVESADESDPELEFPFDAILDDSILDDSILEEEDAVGPLSATDWIAPLVQPPSRKRKHKTLATILLPDF